MGSAYHRWCELFGRVIPFPASVVGISLLGALVLNPDHYLQPPRDRYIAT